ncbi:MAG: caspase family protein [Elusimicrobia bacterium]|nr:caspase family protein [Elusimicrobiota bacterium]
MKKSLAVALGSILSFGCASLRPTFLRTDAIIPLERAEDHAGPAVFLARFDPIMDDRADRTAVGYKLPLNSPAPINTDRPVTEVFEKVVKGAMGRKGVRAGESPFILKGSVKVANLSSLEGISGRVDGKVVLDLELVNSKNWAIVWSRTFTGVAVGSDYQTVFAAAFQDLKSSMDKDDSILAMKPAFLAAGGRLPTASVETADAAAPAESTQVSSDVDDAARPGPRKPDDYALIIGIDKYQALPAAQYGERDAAAFKKHAQKTLGVPEENTIFLTGSRATKTGIERYIEEWLPRNVGEDSRVYFYYSGHGSPDPQKGTAYIIPWDGDASYLQTSAYPVPRLYERLAGLKAREVVVLLDSCFSGAGGRSVIAKGARPLVPVAEAVVPEKLAVLTAASSDQIAGGLDEQGHGMFTYFLLKGLQGAAGKDGHLSLAELHSYIKENVLRSARRQNREQTPGLFSSRRELSLY